MRRAFLALAAILALAGCSPGVERPPCPAGKVCLEYGNGYDPTSLDPHKISLVAESTIVGDLMVGLVEEAPDGTPVPGVAESWETSTDGLVWTFHLRKSSWSDGTPLTAEDFVYSLRRIMDPRTASSYAYLLYVLKNGEAVNAGRLDKTALGVRALDDQTLQITLEHPAPYLPQIAKHASMYAVPRRVVERWGDAWADPAHFVSNGPFRPIAWKLGDHIEVVKNPNFYDAARVCVDRIDYYPTTDAISAERRVRRGELDVNTTFQSNRIGYLRGPDGMPAYVRTFTYLSTTYLPFNTRDVPALKDQRVRNALSMAIDREFIAAKLMRSGQQPAYAFVPPGTDGYVAGAHTSWSGWTLARRQAEARRLLAEAGYGPVRPLSVELKISNTSDALHFAPAIQADWKAIGVKADLIQNEPQIAYQAFKTRDFQIGLANWVFDFNDPLTFLGLFQSKTGQENYSDYNDPGYDALLAQADHEPDAGRRAQILVRAEQRILDAAALAPLYYSVSRNLVSPRVTGWIDNVSDIHRARYLCVKASR